jgi:sugar phosphate permease
MAFIGGMMAHTPFAYLYELFGWRQALLIDGAVGAALLVWIFLIVKDKPAEAPIALRTNQGNIIPSFIKALANKQNWLAGLYTCLLNLPIMVLCALWGASYLQVAHHLPDIAASNVISLIFMGSVIGCPLVGWLSDAQGRRKPLMIFGALATLVCLIPLFMHLVLSQAALSVIFFSLGFFTSTQVISYPLIAESNDAENTGSATGIASVLIMGGAGVGQVLFGWLMTYHANNTQYALDDFQFALWIFPIAAVAALVAVLMTRETYCKR